MPSPNTKLHVLVGAKNVVMAIYEAPPADAKHWTIARPAKGQRVLEVDVASPFKALTFEKAHALVKPLLKSASLIKRG